MNAARFARPYAQAAFNYASEHRALDKWSAMLRVLAAIVSQPQVIDILQNPRYGVEVCTETVLALGQDNLDKAGQNLVKTLATYQRLVYLPDIYTTFEQLRAIAQKKQRVKLRSAIDLSDETLARLMASLEKKLGCAIELTCEIDPEVLGGFIAYVGDRVIDNSLRGQLEKLRRVLVSE